MEKLNYDELMKIEVVGSKAVAAIVGGTIVVGGVAAGGFYLGYKKIQFI